MKNKNLFRLIGVFGGFALLLIAFLLFSAPFLSTTENLLGGTYYTSGYELAFPKEGNAVGGVVAAWVFALLLLILALGIAVVFTLQLVGVMKWKETAMMAYLCGGAFAVLGLIGGILALCTMAFGGWTSNSVFNFGLGAGAVFSGLFSILGAGLMCFGLIAPFCLKK